MSNTETNRNGNNPERWLDDHGDYLFRYALIRVSGKDIAEDLVQETLLAALKSFSGFDGKSSMRTWLTSIMKHKIMDHLRSLYKFEKKRVEPEYGDLNDFFDSGQNKGRWLPGHAPTDWSESPDQAVNQKEFMRILKRCLASLPQKVASVFNLSEIEGKGTNEICKELEISATNYWVIMHRARNGLRKCLESHWFDK